MARNRKTGATRQERLLRLLRPRSNRNDDNRRRVVWIVVLVLFSIEVPELPTYIYYLDHDILTRQKDWFSPWHHQKIAEYWYYKTTCDQIGRILMTLGAIKAAVQYSTVAFLILFMYLFYPLYNLAMFWINYNQWPMAYEFMILMFYVAGRGLIHPYRPESFARIKSIF